MTADSPAGPHTSAPTTSRQSKTNRFVWGAVLVLLGGAFLRLASLDVMSTMLNWDEAWDGADALSLLTHPRLTPFFLTNNGRESGWMYWLAPYILALGAKPFAVRLAAAFAAILTLALAYRLGREILGRAGGLWTLAGLGVLYWPVQLAHRVLRFNLYLLVGTTAALLLLTAYRTNRRLTWLAGGAALGVLTYTYYSSATWILYLGLVTAGVALVDRQRRAGAILAVACAAVLALPMAGYLVLNRAQVLERPAAVSALSAASLVDSGRHWIDAWFRQGDLNAEFNLPGRPIFDTPTGLLAICGLLGFARLARRRADGLLVLGFGLAAWLPSFLSDTPPNFSRAAGLVIPIALLLGAGGAWLAGQLQRLTPGQRASASVALAGWLPMLLVLWAGAATFHDFNQVWVQSTGLYLGFEQHINAAADFVRDHTPAGEAVYFSPFSAAHPDVLYRAADLAPRAVAGFVGGECAVVTSRPAVYASLTLFEPEFQANLARWADLSVLHQDLGGPGGAARVTIFAATARPAQLEPAGLPVARFSDLFEVRRLLPTAPAIAAGQSLSVTLGIRPLGPVPFAPSLFVHLYGNPTPYQGGPLWAQADRELCTSYPANLWRTDETIIQSFNLAIPASVPPGNYTVAIGLYPFPNGTRLPVTFPANAPPNYFTVCTLTVLSKQE